MESFVILWISIDQGENMGYPTKVQLISRQKGNQWYVNFPTALAKAMNFEKGETVEWTVISTTRLQMDRTLTQTDARKKKK
jgi:antitoxin component of MazEF toxin-antitoxin module